MAEDKPSEPESDEPPSVIIQVLIRPGAKPSDVLAALTLKVAEVLADVIKRAEKRSSPEELRDFINGATEILIEGAKGAIVEFFRNTGHEVAD